MQVSANYQPSFKGLDFTYKFNASMEEKVKDTLYKRLPKTEVEKFFSVLEKSPVKTTLGIADVGAFDRLDATVYYKKDFGKEEELCNYVAEGKIRNLFNIKPRKFIKKVLLAVETIEETFQIGRYAK